MKFMVIYELEWSGTVKSVEIKLPETVDSLEKTKEWLKSDDLRAVKKIKMQGFYVIGIQIIEYVKQHVLNPDDYE